MDGTATSTALEKSSARKRLHRVATLAHIIIGVTVAWESIELLSHEPHLLAWLSLVAGAALVISACWELFASQKHHLALLIVQVLAGADICLSAAEKFREHKHYIQWVMLASGLAAIFAAFLKYFVTRRRERE